ncbi:MAG: AIPR family protein [Candidatus Sericytochromatia bacterium]|nr:AIPR family protein [Candidatus Sericytochromatia bacterium]
MSQTPDCTTLAGAMSADMLNHMLRECGPEVLRSNVRGSLGEHGKINSGIMQTLRNRPERMASYNNGVTINAKGMTFARIGNLVQIQRLLDPEISNGGQSSFSIREAARAGLDLSQVQLPVKILVIPEGPNRAELVRLSARYANSQNPVAKSDLSADNPTLRAAQKQFETSIFNPADPDGYKSATHWVLDCMRNEVATRERFMDEDTLRRFRRRHPVDQRLTRAELARAALAFDGKPHIIARGAEKYFSQWLADFEMKCQSGAEQLNDQWVRNTVGKHLLFCATHKAVRDSRILARSDRTIKIVAYALALVQELLAAHDLRIDFHHLANQGVVGSDLVAGFHELVQVLKDVLSQHSDGSLKEEKTWDWVKATCANIPLTEEFMNASGIVAIRANDRTFRSARKALLDRKTPPEVQGEVASIDHCDRRAVRDWISTDAAREARFGALADRWLEARIGAMALSAADSLSLLALMQTMDKAA